MIAVSGRGKGVLYGHPDTGRIKPLSGQHISKQVAPHSTLISRDVIKVQVGIKDLAVQNISVTESSRSARSLEHQRDGLVHPLL